MRISPTSLHVNDTVEITVVATNTGFVDWEEETISAPVPAGLQFLSFSAPGLSMQDYDSSSGIINVYQMRFFNRGQQKTWIITAKVLPSAAGKTITATANFNSLVLAGYNTNMLNYPNNIPFTRNATAQVACYYSTTP